LEDYYIAQRKDPQNPQITLRIAKTLILKDNLDMSMLSMSRLSRFFKDFFICFNNYFSYKDLGIYALEPGKDICLHTKTNPILNKVFGIAADMKNIIYVIADLKTRKCVVIDAVSRYFTYLNVCSFNIKN